MALSATPAVRPGADESKGDSRSLRHQLGFLPEFSRPRTPDVHARRLQRTRRHAERRDAQEVRLLLQEAQLEAGRPYPRDRSGLGSLVHLCLATRRQVHRPDHLQGVEGVSPAPRGRAGTGLVGHPLRLPGLRDHGEIRRDRDHGGDRASAPVRRRGRQVRVAPQAGWPHLPRRQRLHQEVRAVVFHGQIHLRRQSFLPGPARLSHPNGPHSSSRARNARRSLLLFPDVPAVGEELRCKSASGDRPLRGLQLSPVPALPVGRGLRVPERRHSSGAIMVFRTASVSLAHDHERARRSRSK